MKGELGILEDKLKTISLILRKYVKHHEPVCLFLSLSSAITREEYKLLVHNLADVIDKTKNQLEKMKYITSELLLVEMINPRVTEIETPPEKLKRALAEAKAAGDTFGHDSEECDRAWEQVEAIVAGVVEFDDHHYRYTQGAVIDHPHDYSAIVDFQSLSDLLESIASINHTKRLLKLEDSRVNAPKKPLLP